MSQKNDCGCTNVGDVERVISALSGVAMIARGLRKRSLLGMGLAVFGAGAIYRGVSGECALYKALGINTNGATKPAIVPTIGPQNAGVVADSMGMGSEVSVGGMSPSGERMS